MNIRDFLDDKRPASEEIPMRAPDATDRKEVIKQKGNTFILYDWQVAYGRHHANLYYNENYVPADVNVIEWLTNEYGPFGGDEMPGKVLAVKRSETIPYDAEQKHLYITE